MRKLLYFNFILLFFVAFLLIGVRMGPRSGMDINEPPYLYCASNAEMSVPDDDSASRANHPVGAGTERARVFEYDDDTNNNEEYSQLLIQVPSGVNTSGDATFHIWWTAATPAADKVVVWRLDHLALSSTVAEDWTANYNTLALGDLAAPAAGEPATYDTQTASISSLGWAADDMVELRVTRVGNDGDDTLVGDAWLFLFCVELPVLY